GTITNTVLVLVLMGTLYTSLVAKTYGVAPTGLITLLGGIDLTNGLSEIISAVILTPIIVKALFTSTHLSPNR
ncbi:ECF transporter S component, partial [Enterococcus faecalis]